MSEASATLQTIANRIQVFCGLRVLLGADLASLYGVPTKRFNEAVKRNGAKFPPEFMFRLTEEEFAGLRSQFATSSDGRGRRRYLPQVFTEHGALMAATILNSRRAVEVSIYVIRAFVQLRDTLTRSKELAHCLDDLEKHIEARFASQDAAIADVLSAIRQLSSRYY
jgi:hypothetical protein